MAQSTAAIPDARTPRQFLDPRGLAHNIIERRSWFIGFLLLDAIVIFAIATSPILIEAWNFIWPGIAFTVGLSFISVVLGTV